MKSALVFYVYYLENETLYKENSRASSSLAATNFASNIFHSMLSICSELLTKRS
jgi:hypothetical protein